MDVNPYESPVSLGHETKTIRTGGTSEWFTIYRAFIVGLCFVTVGMGLLLRNISNPYSFNPHLFVWANVFTLLSVPLLALRTLYLLICGHFRQAAIDAALTIGAFLAFIS
jgi:hypothetical protein